MLVEAAYVCLLPELVLSVGEVAPVLHLTSSGLLEVLSEGSLVLRHLASSWRNDWHWLRRHRVRVALW